MGEEAAAEGSEDEELLDELPDGDDGWEYIQEVSETEGSENGTVEKDNGDTDDGDTQGGDKEGEGDKGGDGGSVENLERAVRDGDEHEIGQAFAEAEFEVTKGDVSGFVRKTEEDVTKTAFVPGKGWRNGDGFFSELGWVEEGELTAVGASVLAYAGEIIDDAGDDAALVGYLNSVGVDVFLREAVLHGPDDEDGDGGVIRGFLG
ncbi:MAG: hypothetical protein ACOCRA_00085 [Halobacteria archaeon]